MASHLERWKAFRSPNGNGAHAPQAAEKNAVSFLPSFVDFVSLGTRGNTIDLRDDSAVGKEITNRSAYIASAYIYAAMHWRAWKYSEAPLLVAHETEEGEEWLPDHEVLALLNEPHIDFDQGVLLRLTRMSRDLTGMCLGHKERNAAGGIARLTPYSANDFIIQPDPNGKRIYGRSPWSQMGEARRIAIEDTIEPMWAEDSKTLTRQLLHAPVEADGRLLEEDPATLIGFDRALVKGLEQDKMVASQVSTQNREIWTRNERRIYTGPEPLPDDERRNEIVGGGTQAPDADVGGSRANLGLRAVPARKQGDDTLELPRSFIGQVQRTLVCLVHDEWLTAVGKRALARGVEAGEGIPELANRIEEAGAFAPSRAELIARTEATAVTNQSGRESLADWSKNSGRRVERSWLSPRDGLASTWDRDLQDDIIERGAVRKTLSAWRKGDYVIPQLDSHDVRSIRSAREVHEGRRARGRALDEMESRGGRGRRWGAEPDQGRHRRCALDRLPGHEVDDR